MPDYQAKPDTCIGCLWEHIGAGYAAGSGPSNAKLAVIAESLGENEAIQGIPLVGWSGGELNRFLRAHNTQRQEVYCDNIVRCKPPAGNKTKIPKEVIAFCTERHLNPALAVVKPNAILALGNYSLKHLVNVKGGGSLIGRYRGSLLWSERFATKVVPTYHPAWLAKGTNARVMYPFVEFDVGKAVKEARSADYFPPVERYWISPTYADIQGFMDKIRGVGRAAIDIETSGGNWWNTAPLCVGFFCDNEAMCVPILGQYGADVWGEETLTRVVVSLGEILADESVTKVFQNGPYDIIVLEDMGFAIRGPLRDTMIEHHAIVPEKGVPHDLAFIGSIYTNIPFYKDDVKGADNFALLSNQVLRTYNCRDVNVTWRADIEMDAELDEYDARETYNQDMRMIRPLIRVIKRGALIDQSLLKQYRRELDEQIDESLDVIRSIVGSDFVTIRPKDGRPTITPKRLKHFLFDELHLEVTGLTASHEPKTDIDALIELMEQAGSTLEPVFISLIEWRKIDKLRSTYFKEFILDLRGRLHTQYTLHVTPTGRLSSKEPNLQNLPDGKAKEIFIASPGFRFLSRDYSQIEAMIFAYLSEDEDLINVFETGRYDIHHLNTSDLFAIPYGTHTKEQRDFGKTFMYGGLLYGGTPPTIRKQAINRLIKASIGKIKFSQILAMVPSVQRIEQLQSNWFAKHPKVLTYRLQVEDEIKRTQRLRTPLGRVRLFIGPLSENIRAGYNFKIQATASGVINDAFVALDSTIAEPSGIVLQIHDELMFEVLEDDVERVTEVSQKLMEKPVRLGRYEVKFPTALRVGRSWGAMEKAA